MTIQEEIKERGRRKSRQEGHKEAPISLLQKNLETPFISEVTGLPEQKIHKLKNGRAE